MEAYISAKNYSKTKQYLRLHHRLNKSLNGFLLPVQSNQKYYIF